MCRRVGACCRRKPAVTVRGAVGHHRAGRRKGRKDDKAFESKQDPVDGLSAEAAQEFPDTAPLGASKLRAQVCLLCFQFSKKRS